MTRNLFLLLVTSLVASLVALAACSSPPEVPEVTVIPTTDPGRCPIKVPGATATTDMTNAITITFTTETGEVDELRKRVGFLGDEHNNLAARQIKKDPTVKDTVTDTDGSPARKMSKPGDDGAMPVSGRKMAPMATATVEDVENGAKITLVPAGGTALADLKAHVTRRAEALAGGECMMPSLAIVKPEDAPAAE